jgi:hypothetical protein
MDDPIDAFAWLLTQFRKFSRNELFWREASKTLHEADQMLLAFRAQREDDTAD